MSKKIIFIGIVGILILSFLSIPAESYGEQYYDQYPGMGLLPADESVSYHRIWDSGSIYHNDTSDADYNCPVTFNVPDGSVHFIKSIGIRYYDNLTDGYIYIEIKRHNLYTGANHTVATWWSGLTEALPSYQTASKGTEPGFKLIDTKKFSYWLHVWFFREGDVNPAANLILFQIRIHYGT
jgi:hypothetical protein